MKEIDNILRILRETRKAIQEKNFGEVKALSDQTNNTASLTQDPDNIAVAVIVYALSKVLEREHYKQFPQWNKFYKLTLLYLDASIQDLEQNNINKFRKDFIQIRESINKLSGKLKDYIQDVFNKASINKASKIYEHGVSMEQTAKLLGITMYDLATYAGGQRQISDIPESKTISAKERIKITKDIFK